MKSRWPQRTVAWVLVALVLGGVFGSESVVFAAAHNGPAAAWPVKMQALYRSLADLLTDVTSDRRFNDPARRATIQKNVDELARLSHDVARTMAPAADPDPTVQIISALMGSEVKRASKELRRGNRSYARSILRNVPSYCIACHTRNATGPQFSQLSIEPAKGALSALERSEFYAATRQFDRAQGELNRLIQSPTGPESSTWDWERAVRQALVLAVRVKKSPEQAMTVVNAVLGAAHAPAFLKEDAKGWLSSIKDWQNESSRKFTDEAGYYAEAVRLLAKARELQKYPMDRTADIVYLRASAAVHDLMQFAPNGVHAGDALLLAGLTYEVLAPLRVEDLHTIYYEACVRRSPHTELSENCFRRFESSAVLGYTGSAGVEVPEDLRAKLRELRGLAQVLRVDPRQPQ